MHDILRILEWITNHILIIISDDDRLGNLEPDDLQSPMTPNDNGDVDWDALYGMFDLK